MNMFIIQNCTILQLVQEYINILLAVPYTTYSPSCNVFEFVRTCGDVVCSLQFWIASSHVMFLPSVFLP